MKASPSQRCVVIEDDPVVANLVSALLRFNSDVVDVAMTLAEGRKALAFKASLLVLDLNLPDSLPKDTLKAIPSLKQAGVQRVVCMTGHEITPTLTQLAQENGAEVLLSKLDLRFAEKLQALMKG